MSMALGLGLGLSFSPGKGGGGGGGGQTTLQRETNGTVNVITLGTPYTPTLTRQPDGTVIVSG